MIKLNIGCGLDYRNGYINIDGSEELEHVDKIINFDVDSIKNHFGDNTVDFILANDFVEHHFHWEATQLLEDFYQVLTEGGSCEIRVPNTEFIILSKHLTTAQKVTLLYGGQDIPQGTNEESNNSRRKNPQFFCHKYGWTESSLTSKMSSIGFKKIHVRKEGTNIVLNAHK